MTHLLHQLLRHSAQRTPDKKAVVAERKVHFAAFFDLKIVQTGAAPLLRT